jgi:hypothetical protein
VIIQHEHPRRCSGRNCHVSARFRRMTVNPIDERFLGACQTALERVGRKFTISGQLFPKSDGNSQFPDRFGKSCPAIGKVGRNSKKRSSILKSRTEIGNSGRKFSKVRPHFVFPSGFCQSCPEFEKVRPTFEKVGQLWKKSDGKS